MKTSTRRIFIVIAALTSSLLLYTHLHKQQPASSTGNEGSLSPALLSKSSNRASSSKLIVDSAAAPPTSVAATHIDYAAEFRRSTNYHTFVRQVLAAAQAGDRDAAYYLGAALAYCNETHRYLFERRGKVLSVEEAIAERARFPGKSTVEEIHRAIGRCREVYEAANPTWGTPESWIAKAADAGQPLAQVRTATAALLDVNRAGAAGARRLGKPDEVLNEKDARELIRIAMESRDPEVIFQTGDLLGVLKPDMPIEETAKEMLVWRYAACLRGADCSKDAEWTFAACLFDPNCVGGLDGIDYLRDAAIRMELFDLEARANVVLSKIDEMAWRELGLGDAPE